MKYIHTVASIGRFVLIIRKYSLFEVRFTIFDLRFKVWIFSSYFPSPIFLTFLTFTLAFGRTNNTPLTMILSPTLTPFLSSTTSAVLTPVSTFLKMPFPFLITITWLDRASGIIALVGTTIPLTVCNSETLTKAPGSSMPLSSMALTFKFLVLVLI